MFSSVREEEARAWEAVKPVAAGLGLTVVDVQIKPGLAQVFVDREGGVDLDTLEELSLRLSVNTRFQELLPATEFSLEVSSPGLERELRCVEQLKWALGRQVSVRFKDEEVKREKGQLIEVSEESIKILSSSGVLELPIASLMAVKTVFEFEPSFNQRSKAKGRQGKR